MSKIVCTFTPVKRQRQSQSTDSSSGSPAHKRQVIGSPSEILIVNPYYHQPKQTGIMHSSDSEDDLQPNVEDIKHKVDFDKDAPLWGKQMFDLICHMNTKIDNVIASHSIIETTANNALVLAEKNKKDLQTAQDELYNVQCENVALKKKVNELESYSKKYNLKFFNVPEDSHENSNILMNKLGRIIQSMGLDLRRFHIDNLHRLPHSGKGPRPLIVKFVTMLDRNTVWSKRSALASIPGNKVVVREHFAREIEENVKIMLPFRKAAEKQNLNVKMIEDKLILNSQTFTVKNLHLLPPSLQPEKISTRVLEDHLFFYSSLCPLSNHHSAKFTVDKIDYESSEQYIMRGKAVLFNDKETAALILKAPTPSSAKSLGYKVKGFSEEKWLEKAEEIASIGIEQKFAQNPHLKAYLCNTGTKTLIEASPTDKVWGIGVYMYDDRIMSKKSSWGENMLGRILMKVRDKLNDT